MKCSYQCGSELDQSKLVNWMRSIPVQGEVRFSSAFHFRSQVGKRVREMINSFTSHLKEETSEDIEHKVWCVTELTTNTQPREEMTAIVGKLHTTVDELEASMENLAMKAAKLFAQVSNQVDQRPFRESEEIDPILFLEATVETSEKGCQVTPSCLQQIVQRLVDKRKYSIRTSSAMGRGRQTKRISRMCRKLNRT